MPVFAAIIDHGGSSKFLPSLPPYRASLTAPNDAKKNLQQVKEACRAAERVLMGPSTTASGFAMRYEWTVETYSMFRTAEAVRAPDGQASKDRVIDVFRVFGMTASDAA